MRKILAEMAVFILFAMVSAHGAQAGERILVPGLAGWVTVSQIVDASGESSELVAPGETADTWTRRASVQAFRQTAMTVPEFLEQIVGKTGDVCDSATAGPVTLGRVAGAEAGSRLVACGRYKGDGRGSVTLFYVIRGREAFYVVSRLWRGEPFPSGTNPVPVDELADWQRFVASVTLCDDKKPGQSCAGR